MTGFFSIYDIFDNLRRIANCRFKIEIERNRIIDKYGLDAVLAFVRADLDLDSFAVQRAIHATTVGIVLLQVQLIR